MFFILKYFLRGSKRHLLHSSNILSSFHKAKEELNKLNESIHKGIEANDKKAAKIAQENAVLNKMKQSHEKVITNIENFLDV